MREYGVISVVFFECSIRSVKKAVSSDSFKISRFYISNCVLFKVATI